MRPYYRGGGVRRGGARGLRLDPGSRKGHGGAVAERRHAPWEAGGQSPNEGGIRHTSGIFSRVDRTRIGANGLREQDVYEITEEGAARTRRPRPCRSGAGSRAASTPR